MVRKSHDVGPLVDRAARHAVTALGKPRLQKLFPARPQGNDGLGVFAGFQENDFIGLIAYLEEGLPALVEHDQSHAEQS